LPFLQLRSEAGPVLLDRGDEVLQSLLRLGEVARVETRVLARGGDLPGDPMEIRLARGQVLGLGFAREPREQRAGTGSAHLQLRQVAAPALALAADVVGRGSRASFARRSASSARFGFALRALEFAVEVLDRRLSDAICTFSMSTSSRHSSIARTE
jgi:hypothetical protein